MYVNVTKNTYKNKTYYSVRIFETYYQNRKKINKVVKKIGNTTNLNEVEKLKKTAWDYILETQKDIRLSLSEIKRIKPRSPIGLMKNIERIFSTLDVLQTLKNIFVNNYDEFMEEIAYRFYSITSERMLFLITGKPKDRYYRLLDDIFPRKRELENLFYNALVKKSKITKHEVKIDTTSTYFEGNGVSLAMYGYSRDHRGDKKQVIILLVLIDNYPLFSYVFEGNKKDVTLFLDTVKDLKARIKCKRFIIFCDRGFFNPDYLDALDKDRIFYVMAVPRRKGDWPEHHNKKTNEFSIEGRRAVLYENTNLRKELLRELDETVEKIRKDLKKLTPSEIKRKYKYALKFINIKKKTLKEKMVEKEKKVLGRWIVLTNLKDKDKTGEEIIDDYKSLQEIERDFRILKSELNLRPVGHSNDNRSMAHIFICVLTLLIKHIIEKEFGRDKFEEIKDIFSYEIVTEKGAFLWTEKF